jgi:hypothetical protein
MITCNVLSFNWGPVKKKLRVACNKVAALKQGIFLGEGHPTLFEG